MVDLWEPGTYYGAGSVVEYEGHKYKIIQAHQSQSDWAPSATPALWGRLSDDDNGSGQHQQYQPQYQQPPQQQWSGDDKPSYNQNQNQPPPQQGGYQSGDTQVGHDEQKKHWWDLDEKRRKELEVGGGLLAGAALLGGGLLAFKEHKKNEEEKKALTWALQNWIKDAEQRTAHYRQYGPRGPATWILNEGTNIPRDAIVVGQEHDWILYIARAFYEGGILIGKASNVFQKGAVIGYHKEEIQLGTYEILVGNMAGLRWVNTSGHLNLAGLGYRPVEGGRESDGTPIYVAKAPHKGAEHPGKASEKLDGAYIPYGNSEVRVKEYAVLCYA